MTCEQGCAALPSGPQPIVFPHGATCSGDVYARFDAMSAACASSTNTECALSCATEVVNFVHNASCMALADKLLDTFGRDTKEDGKASAVRNYASFCMENQSLPVLTTRIVAMRQRGCVVNTSHVLALPSATKTSAACRDNSLLMSSATGYTCTQVAKQHLCGLVTRHLLPDLCTCTCSTQPATVAHVHRFLTSSRERRLFGVENNACPVASFDAKLKAIKGKCCSGGNCRTGVPRHCSFECAQVSPADASVA